MFFYEKWEVFKLLVELRDVARKLQKKYGNRGLAITLNQLLRALNSAIHNLGEGAKHQVKGHKLERYRITLGEIGESNASFVILTSELPKEPLIALGKELCDRTAGMMTNLIKSVETNWDVRPPSSPDDPPSPTP